MKIGIDVSQIAYESTGVSDYLRNLVQTLSKIDRKNQYILFFSSLRRNLPKLSLGPNFSIRKFGFPPLFLDLIWNKLHILSIEKLIGPVDIFITSDWTEPPAKAKKATILYDLIVYKYPQETHNQFRFNLLNLLISPNIVASQKRKLGWVKKESNIVFCISASTKKDAKEILGIPENKLKVIYPGV